MENPFYETPPLPLRGSGKAAAPTGQGVRIKNKYGGGRTTALLKSITNTQLSQFNNVVMT